MIVITTTEHKHQMRVVAPIALQSDLKSHVDGGAQPLSTRDASMLFICEQFTVRCNRPDVAEEVRAELLGRHGTFRAIIDPARSTVLIGAVVLEDLDLLVDCTHQTLQPRDPENIIAELE